eukprot:1129903-Amphidinium_carterae.1
MTTQFFNAMSLSSEVTYGPGSAFDHMTFEGYIIGRRRPMEDQRSPNCQPPFLKCLRSRKLHHRTERKSNMRKGVSLYIMRNGTSMKCCFHVT